jgi:hypothetical protein
VYYAWRAHPTNAVFERATDRDVRALDDTGFVHLTGTVVATHAETLTSPLAVEEDVVLAAWRVEEYEETGDQSAWMPVASGVIAGTFALADDTGRVAVDPGTHVYDGHSQKTPVGDYPAGVSLHGDANVRVEFDAFPVQHEVELKEDPPAAVAAFLEDTDAVADPVGNPFGLDRYVDLGRPDGDRRYLEATIRPGEDVETRGTPTPGPKTRSGDWTRQTSWSPHRRRRRLTGSSPSPRATVDCGHRRDCTATSAAPRAPSRPSPHSCPGSVPDYRDARTGFAPGDA